jgi:BirA family biotin operon repressor/biotin-[acetyl-CoA-carboxylase] ligase
MGDITFYNEIEGLQVWQIDECPSTFQILDLVSTPNSQAKAVFTFNQTEGKGQEGRIWESKSQCNLAYSLRFPFSTSNGGHTPTLVNMVLSMACARAVASFVSSELKIKWPNDLLVNNKKVAGLLMKIVNIGKERFFELGLGVNVNQIDWPKNLPYASSLVHFNESTIKLEDVAQKISEELAFALEGLKYVDNDAVLKDYNNWLWQRNMEVELSLADNNTLAGILKGVNRTGQILIEIRGEFYNFHLGQARLLIK